MSQIKRFRELKNELQKQTKGSKKDIQIRTEMKKIALQYKSSLIYKGPKIDDFEDLFDNASNSNNSSKSGSNNLWTNSFKNSLGVNNNLGSLNELDDVVYKDDMNNNMNKRMNNNLDILNYNKTNKSKECISPYGSGACENYAAF